MLSACAPTAVELKPPVRAPAVATPAQAASSVLVQASPASSAARAPGAIPAPAVAANPAGETYEAWRAHFIDRAVAAGFERGFVEAELSSVQLSSAILNQDRGQPEFSRPISDYVRAAAAPARAAEGLKRKAAEPHLPEIERRYGVPAEILVAIWADESGFGKVQGDHDVISAFATLAFEGRRREWAETQLIDALVILRDRGIPRYRLKGSWAGAMGQTQFIPEAYLKLGQDGDGDGKVDIWGSDADALASAANHLASEGWRPGESWAVEVLAPAGFDWSLAEGEKRSPAWWAAKGLRRADGRPWSDKDQASQAMLLIPTGANGPAWLAFPNHFVIRKYNNSIAYALSIGLLADEMRGAAPLARAWPKETPLSRDQRVSAQASLAALGYPVGKVDGLIGAETRTQLRAWQKSRGLVADGYLTPELVTRLNAEAATKTAATGASVPPAVH